ncbi:MAG TPA: immunoglobulin-like domain-containing protein [Armatimonadota bacterium]|jgi:hypothetical protein
MRSPIVNLRSLLFLALLGLCATVALGDGLLLSKVDYPVSNAPTQMVASDFNHDGTIDLVTMHTAAMQLTLLPGSEDGTFKAKRTITLSKKPYGLVAADFNNDGNMDLAVADMDDGVVSILFGYGDGSFRAAVDYPAGVQPRGITAADFNNDGALDLVVTNYKTDTGTAALLLNNGDGTFAPKTDLLTGFEPVAVASGDLDNDGNCDLAIANHQDGSVSILLGHGDGTFSSIAINGVGVLPTFLSMQDFDGDGFLEIAVVTKDDVTLVRRTPFGVFIALGPLFDSPCTCNGFAAADLNNDNTIDFAFSYASLPLVGTKIGLGDGTFTSSNDTMVGANPYAVVASDFNRDGRLDIAVTNSGGNTVSVMLNAQPANWTTGYPKAKYLSPTSGQLLVQMALGGTAYAVCLPAGAETPTPEQVMAGTDAADHAVDGAFTGSTVMLPYTEAEMTFAELVDGATYDFFVVAKDSYGKLQIAVRRVRFSTGLTPGQSVTVDRDLLAIGYTPPDTALSVTQNVTLESAGTHGTTISWASNKPDIISTDGTVLRPSQTLGDVMVTLTATIKKDTVFSSKAFPVLVKQLASLDYDIVDQDAMNVEIGYAEGDSATSVTQALTLPTMVNRSDITWNSYDPASISATGAVTRPSFTAGDATVLLVASVHFSTATTYRFFYLTVTKLPISEAEMETLDLNDLAIGYAEGDSAASVTQALMLPTDGAQGSTITWASDTPEVIDATGTVMRPAFTTGNVVVALTATVSNGAATPLTTTFYLTVIKLPINDDESIDAALATVTIGYAAGDYAESVTRAITLPIAGAQGTTISWASSSPEIIGENGWVTRPTFTDGNAIVNMTATVSKGLGTPITLPAFTLTVIKLPMNGDESIEADLATVAIGYALGDNAVHVTRPLTLATTGAHGTTITWTSTDSGIVGEDGSVTRPSFTAGNATVTLTATVSKGAAQSASTDFTLTVVHMPISAEEEVLLALADLQIPYAEGERALSVTKSLALPFYGTHGTSVSWQSDKHEVMSDYGTVNRPSFVIGDISVLLTATLTKGGASATKTFRVTVTKLPPNDTQAVTAVLQALDVTTLSGAHVTRITESLYLPTSGDYGTTIRWQTSAAKYIQTNGLVNRPAFTTGDMTVVLTATVSKGKVAVKKTFQLVVVKLPPTDSEAITLDAKALTIGYATGDSAGRVTQRLTLPTSGAYGSAISWLSSAPATVSTAGVVVRPAYKAANAKVTLTATVRKGAVSLKRTFTLTVVKQTK